ncbi:reprolysin-like metallopeptidase [Epilithonimonas mollis]|uniref:Por secretion system C-terminal sorting domain-containing protein n=1 Tax=Epilithonimonas mollis TaxID=216903 RepID=A0A1M6P9F5_9FLAO|nr:M12 family metallo-peptidase [Epilithonimonas mollis]SHK04585.1 Por secretion system C-terminal sorting domain-containing protein [Epilithonimonas mollis]
MKKIFTTLFSVGIIAGAYGQWAPSAMKGEHNRDTKAKSYYSLDLSMVRSQLSEAKETGKNSKPVIINLPTLDGKIEKFAVYSLPVVEKSMADRYQLGSYVGVKTDDPTVYVRFSVSPYDLQAMMLRNGQYEFIEPLNKEKTVYGVFPKTNKRTGGKAFECNTSESLLSKKQMELLSNSTDFTHVPTDFNKASDKKYRTYRLAISVTGEYTQYFGGVPQAAAAINATMTRVNGVFEKDFAIHMNVQDFPQLIYTNPSTDPYSPASTGAGGAWNLEVQKTLTSVIGNAAYDIGHLFGSSGGGGSAGDIGNVCRNPANANDDTSKGSGFTSPGTGGPEGDNFDIDYVAHEMGHQFGADHTFSHGIQSAPYNSAHMEPGSGSTIMGYAGITSADVQPHSDAYFHVRSIEQVQTYVNTQTCDVNTVISNNPPVVAALPNKTIPKGTAFVLTASATDPENNPLTYTWEEYDKATSAVTNVTGNNTSGPKFRSITGSALSYRYFPKLSNVLNGNLSSASDWEAVSNVARTMNFRVVVRDNNPDLTQQQTQIGSQTITVGNDGPFKVTSAKVYNNAPSTFTWDIANTNNAPYSVSNVKIDYTTNNGNTWTVLAASTPNDGSEAISFASIPTDSQITVRVSAIDNVFYAVGKVTVSAMVNCDGTAPAGLAVSGITKTDAKIDWDAIADATYALRYKKTSDASWINLTGISSNTYTLTQLDEDTEYNVEVASVCSGTTGAYSSKNFRTLGLTYCSVSSSDSTDEYIAKVVVTPANGGPVMTSSSGASNYTNYAADNTRLVQLVKGSSGNTMAITKAWSGNTYSEAVAVWIDFNRNGTYEDSEKIMNISANTTPTVSSTFSVPANAYTGDKTVGMRVIMRFSTTPTGPCASFTYGEVEDYAVKISETLAVTDVKKNNISVYPNPATDVIHISNISSKTRFEIYSVGGQLVNQGATDGKVKVSSLAKGVYILSLESNGEKSQTKFIKN